VKPIRCWPRPPGGRRSTARLSVDVAVVGGGIAGCAAAVALRKSGLSVVVLDRGRCGAGASGVNFGGVREQGRNLHELPLARRAWSPGRISPRRSARTSSSTSPATSSSRASEADMAELERYAADAAARGLDLQLLGANTVRAELPWLGEAVLGASLSPEDGQANPRVVGPAYARLARRLGVDIREETRVTAAAATPSGFAIAPTGWR